jgi:tight adherence protein B
MTNVLLVSAFATGFLIIFAVNSALSDFQETQRLRARHRREHRSRARQRERAKHSLQFQELYEQAAQDAATNKVRMGRRERLTHYVEESGVRLSLAQLVVITAGLGSLAGPGSALASGRWIVGIFATMVAGVLPWLYVAVARQRRLTRMLSQLPDAFDLMSRSLRAGQTMAQAMMSVASEFSAPLADEFYYCCEQQNLGLSTEAALRDLARRSGLLELKIFVLAVVVHRQAGGNLSELLGRLAKMIRERIRIRGSIQALTAEGRMQAAILLALPPLIFTVMLVLNRSYTIILLEYPVLLFATGLSMAGGALWMNRIVHFDF